MSSPLPQALPLAVEHAVSERYTAAARQVEPALCCRVEYEPKYLAALPPELIERDYGCGDPTRYVLPGESVLDLGCGAGKVCYIASQVVGPAGSVIGIDMNDEMLALAQSHQADIAKKIGWSNVQFYRGRIQDLSLSLDELDSLLRRSPIKSANDWCERQAAIRLLRRARPLIPTASIDVVLSNCVLNLVDEEDRRQLFAEVFRVLGAGGRAVISDIVSSQVVPDELKNDPELWSGCISGAFEEQAFYQAFADAGLTKVELLSRQAEPWRTIGGIEFRSVTVRAWKLPATAATATLPVEAFCTTGSCC